AVERRKPESDRDWTTILGAIESYGNKALEGGCQEIWASAVRSRVLILSEDLGRSNEAFELARGAVGQCRDEPLSRLIIGGIVGEKLLGEARVAEAREVLVEAVLPEDLPPFHETMKALLCTSRAVGDSDPLAASEYARRAVDMARQLRHA